MSGYGTLPTDEPHTPIILPGSTGPRPAKWRFELGELLESKRAHWTVLFLVCLDAVAVLTEIIVELFEECGGDSGHAIVEEWFLEFLTSISIVVASLFVLECIASLIAFGPRFYLPGHPHWFLHSLDFVVVTTTLCLEVFLAGKERKVAGLLILFRLWRIIKIMEAVALGVTVREEEEETEEEERFETTVQALDREKKKSTEFKRLLNQEREHRRRLEIEIARVKGSVV